MTFLNNLRCKMMYQTPVYTFKRMVYGYYCSNDENSDFIKELHLKMLERYINIFDDVIFCIIIDDINNLEVIRDIQKRIISIRRGSITFKLYENSNYRESDVFYNEIFLKMKELNGLTFFGHSKGVGVLESYEEIIAFVLGSYYFSLENIDKIGDYPFYGSFKMINNLPSANKTNKHKWFYVGTFFWGDYQRIYGEHKKWPLFSSRWFNELFPGEFYEHEKCGCLDDKFIDATEPPKTAFELIEKIYDYDDNMQKYLMLYNELIEYFNL